MNKIFPLPLHNIKKENKNHELYTIIVNSLVNKYAKLPEESLYRTISKMQVSYKHLDKFVLDNTIRGRFYKFLLRLSHMLVKYNKLSTIKLICDGIMHRSITCSILFLHKNQKKMFVETTKIITIYPWRTAIEMDDKLYDYNYKGITDGIMNIILNIFLKNYNILDIQSIKLSSDISYFSKKINKLEYKFKESF